MSVLQFTFDKEKHEYRENGVVLPSVTQIINEFIGNKFDMVDPEVLARKQQLGRLVHQACHFFDENDLPETLHPEVAARLEGYKEFRKVTGYTPEINEFQQIGVVHGMKFGMQFDSIGICGGSPWIVDIKNGVYSRTWGLQLAAYDMAIAGHKKRTRVAVQLFPDGRYKLHTFSDLNDYDIFTSLLALSNWKRNNKIA